MGYTTCAFYENVNNAALAAIAAVADQHLTVNGNDITIPPYNQLVGGLVMGSGLSDARLSTPSLRAMFLPRLEPFLTAASLPTNQNVNESGSATYTVYPETPHIDRRLNPLVLQQSEKLNVEVQNGGAADAYAVLFLADKPIQEIEKEDFSLKLTATGTAVIGQWVNLQMTPAETLPAGAYDVIGMSVKSDNMVAARLVFVGGTYRPGVIGHRNYEEIKPNKMFRHGQMGLLGNFEFDQLPTIDVLCTAADTSFEIWLDLVQTRKGR